ncbi:putative zinc metalloprotease EGY2, chloroplastic [Gracilariopsis chorda]|uniref:Putative zinc metalloprotease EGY2, chloroplastic n=1 Tax=Gracilariopsis chorda TaxID=448386 RepID=A0A2V3J2Y1_9FLOR|nr:putative zinc metalloprotease EGY2, chloroplastic [Gracilariopsis chorda]|eukprot:PXF48806.1 putative zinc metalloprotease EGY2, chloroplastic [Gracilariopsis chorda]
MYPSPAFLTPVPLTRSTPFFRPRVCRPVLAKPLSLAARCSAQGETTQSSPSQLPNDTSPPSTQPPVSPEERKEKARLARLEAQRLELMAAKARLEFERAELQAERKRLELDKMKNIKYAHDASKPAPSLQSQNPYENQFDKPEDRDVNNQSSTTTSNKSKKPPPISAGSLSEILSVEFPRVSESDIEIIKEKLCGMKTFFVTDVDRSPFDERVVFRGNMRLSADKLLDHLEILAKKEGIADRVRLFLLYDPKDTADGDDKRPVLVALPAAAKPRQTNTFSAIFSVVLGFAACFTTFSYGIGIFGLTPDVVSEIAKGSLEEALLTVPVSAGAIAISLIHDIGHRVAASVRGIKLGLPFFIPSLQIGTYGTITPLESYPRLRRDMFDFAVAGPIVGTLVSLAALIAGLVITGSGEVANWFPQVPSNLFHASVLVGAVADIILPPGLREQATIAVHPLTVIGYTGLLVNALNLMPIGRLDGGRIVQALYGRAIAGRASALTLFLQAVSSLVGNSPLLLFWGLVCVFLQRESDYPCQNEVIEPDSTRTAIGLAALCVMLLVLIPFPDQIGNILGQY